MNLGSSIVNLDKVAVAVSLGNWEQKLKGLDVCQYPEHSSAKYWVRLRSASILIYKFNLHTTMGVCLCAYTIRLAKFVL